MKRTRTLGQYFTPLPVVDQCYRLLQALDPTPNPRIIDPACGEGVFLTRAPELGITTPDRIVGVERDPSVAPPNALIQDGLLPLAPAKFEIRNSKFETNSKWENARIRKPQSEVTFDWVVGNPPFGTRCLTTDPKLLDFTINAGRPLDNYPIEILFLERFWQLARPGGFVAIIIPDGILANARLAYVREWLTARASIKKVVSLPQHTFQRHGASSKASILVFKKEPGIPSGARLDPAYYDPKFTENVELLSSLPNVIRFGDLIEYTTYGQVGSREYTESGIRYLTPANLTANGISLSPERFVAPNSRNDPRRSRLRKGDLLFANSGVGCIGRVAVFTSHEPCNISQHINLIRLGLPDEASAKLGIEPEYMAVYLQTRFGRLQIAREKCGVGACGINFDRIKSILVPVLAESSRQEIVCQYGNSDIRLLVERMEALVSPAR